MQHCDPEGLSLMALGEPATADLVDEAHLASCSLCQNQLEDLAAVVATAKSVRQDDIPGPPPSAVWDSIAEELQLADRSAPGAVSDASPPMADVIPLQPGVRRRASRGAPWFAVAAAAVVGLVGGAVIVQAVDRPAEPTIVASAALGPLSEPSADGAAELELVGNDRKLTVDVRGLPPTDGFYEVWLLDESAEKLVSLGTLGAQDSGVFQIPADLDVAQFPVVDVSREPLDGNPAHSADSVVRGTLTA